MIHRQWCAQIPFMTKDSYISFKDYRDMLLCKNVDTRPANVIVAEILEQQAKDLGDKDGN